tara:strand:- start:54 stop:314 length:261 start_codon:yes stop_codon:yes gene_type:complete
MALAESIEYDKIEIVGKYKMVQVRKATVIKRDGVEIPGARSYERYVLEPDADISAEPTEIVAICNTVWTQQVKDEWKAYRESVSQQ